MVSAPTAKKPDEKKGFSGRNAGGGGENAIVWLSLSEEKHPGGGMWPAAVGRGAPLQGQSFEKEQ